MNKLINRLKKEYLILLSLLILIIPVLVPLTKPGFFPTQDFIYVARVYEMKVALDDGNFPVRWAKDFRNGEPLFNFYAPLPYYVGAFIKSGSDILGIGLSYLVTVKILFAAGFILSTLAMYFFAKRIFGTLGGFVSALMYLYSPYHSVDVYVRGALSESWALIFFPLIFLTAFNLSENKSLKNTILLSLSLAGLFFTHNIMTMLGGPFILAWMGFLVFKTKNKKLPILFLISLVWSVGLAATFLLPAFLEKGFVQTAQLTTGYFDYRGHFAGIKQWFSPYWGYGASLWGPEDDMSFQIGLANWGIYAFTGFAILLGLLRVRKDKLGFLIFNENLNFVKWREYFSYFFIFSALFIFSLIMTHNQSAFIWERFDVMKFTQFPWRFLGISIFFVSLTGGFFALLLKERIGQVVAVLFVLFIVLMNVSYFRPDSYYLDSIDDHFVSDKTLSTDDKLPRDYLPIWVKTINKDKLRVPHFNDGEGVIKNFVYKTGKVTFDASSAKDGAIETPITYFPGWEAKINGQKTDILDTDNYGLIRVKVPAGENKLEFNFRDPPIRSGANILSIFSIGILILLLFKKPKIFN